MITRQWLAVHFVRHDAVSVRVQSLFGPNRGHHAVHGMKAHVLILNVFIQPGQLKHIFQFGTTKFGRRNRALAYRTIIWLVCLQYRRAIVIALLVAPQRTPRRPRSSLLVVETTSTIPTALECHDLLNLWQILYVLEAHVNLLAVKRRQVNRHLVVVHLRRGEVRHGMVMTNIK
jgi:hypothetical protein